MTVEGSCHPSFEPLRDLLASGLDDGTEIGASLAVVHDGELVTDLWGGEAAPGRPWEADTIVQTWSVTKTMSALTLLVLADRGVIDLDAPIETYWPIVARGDVLVRHVLAHTSGYAGWTEHLGVDGLLDLQYAESLLAAQDPWWKPGTASGYHMLTYGHLVDGIIRGATGGSTLPEQFRELIAEPLGVDFHLGVPDEALERCADLVPPPAGGIDIAALPEGNLLVPTLTNPVLDIAGLCNTAPWRQTSIAAANGHGNARSIARAQSVVSHGGEVDGVRLLSPEIIDRIFEVQAEGPDLVLLVPLRWGIGYALPHPTAPAVPDGRVCWWTGYGGSIVVNDLDRRTTVAYTMNRMVPHFTSSPRTDAYVRTAFTCLEEALS